MIIKRPTPEQGICFAWLPKDTPDGWVWLEFVQYTLRGGWYHTYRRLIPQDRYDRGERVSHD